MNLSEWVDLRGGVSVPLAVIVFAIDLEDQGWEVARMEDKLLLRPKTQNATKAQQSATPLSDEAKMRIRQVRDHLIVVARYLETLDSVVLTAQH